MLAGVTVILALLGLYFGFANLIIPVPLALLVYRHGLKSGILVSLASAILATLILGSLFVGLEVVIIGVIGIALGIALREKFNFIQLFVVGTASSIIATVLKFITYSTIAGFNLLDELVSAIEMSSEQVLSFWQGVGFSEEMLLQYSEVLTAMPALFKVLFPLLLVFLGIIQAFANLFVIRAILKRLGDSIPWIPPFAKWKWPWYFVWGFIFGRIFSLIQVYYPSEVLHAISLNLDVFFLYAFFVQGLAIAWHIMDRFNMAKILRFVLIFFVLITGWIWVILIALAGVLDTWFDFRKLKVNKEV